MTNLKPAYLIHGDDHGRIAERRASLRKLAEERSGASGIELFEGETADPGIVAAALGSMTFALGWRFIIVDGVERWKDSELELIEQALAALPPETTVTFFAREEGRYKASERLHRAVKGCGGDVRAEQGVKPWELPKWVVAQASSYSLSLDLSVARALVERVGERQQRLLRELEKLQLTLAKDATVTVEDVELLSASSSERKTWSLADAVVAKEPKHALRYLLELLSQGERVAGLLYPIAGRVRSAIDVKGRLDSGESAAQVKRSLRMPPKAADRFLSDVQAGELDELQGLAVKLAELELASRGGTALSEETVAVQLVKQQ